MRQRGEKRPEIRNPVLLLLYGVSIALDHSKGSLHCASPQAKSRRQNLIPIYRCGLLHNTHTVRGSRVLRGFRAAHTSRSLLIFKLKIIILRTQFSAICQNIVYCRRQVPILQWSDPPMVWHRLHIAGCPFSPDSLLHERRRTLS